MGRPSFGWQGSARVSFEAVPSRLDDMGLDKLVLLKAGRCFAR